MEGSATERRKDSAVKRKDMGWQHFLSMSDWRRLLRGGDISVEMWRMRRIEPGVSQGKSRVDVPG